MTESQGALAPRTVIYPTGYVAERADDVHSATYVQNSLSEINNIYFVDDYTNVCDKLHVQVDDCDAYGPFYVPILFQQLLQCPLEKKEDKEESEGKE
jgi:hypothetical protein